MLATGRSAAPGPAGATPHGIVLSDRSTVGETFGVTSLDQITASRQRSRLRSCGFSCHPDCCVMGPTLPREGFKASQIRGLGSASDPGNHWAAIPAVLLGPDCGDEPLIHVLDGATGESWHQRYDGSCAPPGCSPLRQRRGARRRSPPGSDAPIRLPWATRRPHALRLPAAVYLAMDAPSFSMSRRAPSRCTTIQRLLVAAWLGGVWATATTANTLSSKSR
jgi:hypothetical protein